MVGLPLLSWYLIVWRLLQHRHQSLPWHHFGLLNFNPCRCAHSPFCWKCRGRICSGISNLSLLMANVLFIWKLDVFSSSITYDLTSSTLINSPESSMLLSLIFLQNLCVSGCFHFLYPIKHKWRYSPFVALTLIGAICRCFELEVILTCTP